MPRVISRRQGQRRVISHRNDILPVFQSAYEPRCIRIAVYFVLIIAPRMHAPSMAGGWSVVVHADIISVQISETPETRARLRAREAQNCAATGINLIGRHARTSTGVS